MAVKRNKGGFTPTMLKVSDAAWERSDHRLPESAPPAAVQALLRRKYITPSGHSGYSLTVAGVLALQRVHAA